MDFNVVISLEDALISKIYMQVLETAEYTSEVLDDSLSVDKLRKNTPSFAAIEESCNELLRSLKDCLVKDSKITVTAELVEIIGSVVYAIEVEDNSLLVDNAYHLEQFLDINARNKD